MVYTVVILSALLLAAITSVAIATRGCKDDTVMPLAQRWLLLGYLLSIGICLVYLIAVLGSADFPEAATALSVGTPAQVTIVADVPVVKRVFPESTIANSPDLSLSVYGQNFHDGAIVRINAGDHATKIVENGVLLSTPLQQSDLTGVSSLTVVVFNPDDKKISNPVILAVTRPRVTITLLGFSASLTRELQLLVLIICAGALGSYVHAIRSLTNFIGNRTVVASWFWWYIARPFVGMSMALMFYAVLRGGFLAGTPADAKFVNPFGVVTIGALVGMFADKAAQKLAEIFDTLFKAEDTRKDKLTSPAVEKVSPNQFSPNTTPLPEVTILGSHLSGIGKVRVNQQERVPTSVDDKQVKFVLTASDLAQVGELSLTLVDKSGTVTSAGTLLVTDLRIEDASLSTPGTLPDGTNGKDYDPVTLTAKGGTAPYRWDIIDSVPDLKIGSETGSITGIPKSAGTFSLTIRLTDSKKASVTRGFKLNVK